MAKKYFMSSFMIYVCDVIFGGFLSNRCFMQEVIINYVITKVLHQSFFIAGKYSKVFSRVRQNEKLMALREDSFHA